MTKKAAAASGTKKRSQAQEVWLRLKKNKQAMAGLAVFCLIVLICFSAPLYMDYDARVIQQHISEKLQAPSAEHLLGTDNYGRDTLARLIFGGRISITIGIVTALSALAVGGLIGAAAGFYGGKLDNIIMRIMDVFLDGSSKLRVSSAPNVDAEIYSKLEKSCMDFAYDTFVELKEKQMQQNEESFKKYMYALELRQEAAEHIGIENIRRSRLQKLQKEKANIEAQHRKGSQVYPDFRLIMMARLEA